MRATLTSMVAKVMTAGMLGAALLLAAPKKAEAQVSVGVVIGHPVYRGYPAYRYPAYRGYGYGYPAGYYGGGYYGPVYRGYYGAPYYRGYYGPQRGRQVWVHPGYRGGYRGSYYRR
ncbi:MAG: hypothetical protein PW789_10395 [Edaphobacter sp.]|uniref:hypothetical protein n=1 Tax=Edaphobacter sp. TaxID=1934404 RepID=UPI0023903F7B|nr:hypothetical protein [Edaphobacter sp.]MDE1177000.1 hypothetical protein [Edaphobacter sp.]